MTFRLTHVEVIILIAGVITVAGFNGDDFELECPDECECHYFRINWVTDCSESNITEVPYDELSKSVYILDLNGNNIKTLKTFPKDMKMRRLQIANNLLTKIEKEAFKGLEYLIDVDLSGNQISYIDPEAFLDAHGLLTLEIEYNPLETVDGPFLISSTLQFLDLRSCNIKEINPQFFDYITSLTTLDLSHNPLDVISPGVFDALTSLETLILEDCKLTDIVEGTFNNLTNLRTLELAGNYLTNVDWTEILGKLTLLQHLNLRKSQIKQIPVDAFSNSSNLVTLILAENELKDLDVASTLGYSLQYLEVLDLSNCHIQEPLTGEAFANASKLKTLYLSGNPLFASDLREALEPLPRLERLFLSNCSLKSLPKIFNVFLNLQELDISHNPLNNVFTKLLKPLDKLEYLNMGYSNLSYIAPDTFSLMTSMKRLVLSGNDLLSLQAGLFGNLSKLETLELEFCGLKRPFDVNAFFANLTYVNLKEIKLAGNPLIPKTGPLLPVRLGQTSKLDLSNCNISALSKDAFKYTNLITDLNLYGNNLSSLPGSLDFLIYLPLLENLNLGGNNLTTIDPEFFTQNPKLQTLNLIGNRFVCNCKIAEMWDWANMVKGNLDLLVGAKSAAQDISLKGNKKKKSLVCHYDMYQLKNATSVNRTIPGRRPFVKPREFTTSSNRTWAKYVRESGCEPVVKILRPSSLVFDFLDCTARDGLNFVKTTAVMGGLTIIFVAAIIILAVRLYKRHNGSEDQTARKTR